MAIRHKVSNYHHFLAKIEEVKSDNPSLPWNTYPCLEWDRYLNHRKTPTIYVPARRKKIRISRLSLEMTSGPIPQGHGALHACDNPPCFRPVHLFVGTQDDNMKDAVNKERIPKGSKNAKAILTEAKVIQIRTLNAKGVSQKTLAALFGVKKSTIWQIFAGRSWRHVK